MIDSDLEFREARVERLYCKKTRFKIERKICKLSVTDSYGFLNRNEFSENYGNLLDTL
jgi:hypothetical protein